MTNKEKQRINENFKKLMKDDSEKRILSFLFMSMLTPAAYALGNSNNSLQGEECDTEAED